MHTLARHCVRTSLVLLVTSGACRSTPAPQPALTQPTENTWARIGALDAQAALAAVCPPEHLTGDTCAICPFDEDFVGPMRFVSARPARYEEDAPPSYLVQFGGCAMSASAMQEYAGEDMTPPNDFVLTLLSEEDGTLELMSYREFIDIDSCVFPQTRDGRDAIVCLEVFRDYSETVTRIVQLAPYDLIIDDELFMLVSDVDPCQPDTDYYSNHTFYVMTLADTDNDGAHELVVEATFEEGDVPEPHSSYCEAINAGHVFDTPEERFHRFVQDEEGYFYEEELE